MPALSAVDYLAPPGPDKIARHEREIEAAVAVALSSGSARAIGDLPPDLAAEARRRVEARLAARGESTRGFLAGNGMRVSWS